MANHFLNLFVLLAAVVLMSLAVKFIITVLDKFGILEWLQSRSNEFFHKLLTCPFCRSFWLALLLSLIILIFSHWWPILFTPFFVAPLGE